MDDCFSYAVLGRHFIGGILLGVGGMLLLGFGHRGAKGLETPSRLDRKQEPDGEAGSPNP